MKEEIKKCPKCGQKMKKSGPYLHTKNEGEKAYEGSYDVYYYCMNKKCENFYKTVKKIES